jgi:DNA-binding XRE family transcriptional regulator
MTKSKKQALTPEVDEMTPEIEALLAQFTDEEVKTGIIAGPGYPEALRHTPESFAKLLESAIIEPSLDRLLKDARDAARMSLREMAEALCVSRARAHQLEQAGANLQLETLQRAAEALGYDVQVTFIPRDEDKAALTAPVP